MILEIRLENFFSIKDEISIDFRAGNVKTTHAKELASNVMEWNGETILKTVGLFGSNASGKSNIIKAISFSCSMILNSHMHNENDIFNFMPFKFEGYVEKPSRFYIDFVCNNIEYEYSFSLTREAILTENLYHYPNGRRAKVFTRDETIQGSKADKYSFADSIITRPLDIAENTSRKTLYLSRGSQMDRDLCKKLYLFFLNDFLLGFGLLNSATQVEILFKQNKDLILHALQICDSDITEIDFVKEKIKLPSIPMIGMEQVAGQTQKEIEFIRFKTVHKHDKSVSFDLQTEESTGTVKLFNILLLLLNVLQGGKALMLDEFDISLHSRLADFIIDVFHASSSSQLLYTTHNTNLIDVKRLRKDQILFVNKKEDSSTEVYSLFDYKDFRENMDAEKGYLQGRFDAVPMLDTSLSSLKKLLGKL